MKKLVLVLVLLLAAGAVWAGPEENFQAGGMELGGELHITWIPDAYISDPESRESEKGNYDMIMDGTGSIGWFLSDNLSFQIMPGFFYMRSTSMNGDNVYSSLWLTLGAGFDYYFHSASPVVFSLGLDGAVTFIPGIDGKDLGSEDPDDSLALEFSLTPNIASYYFITDRVAPYISICPEFYNLKEIKNSNGDDLSYADGEGFMDYWRLMFKVNVGIKFFLPEGFRFLDGRQRTFTDIYKMD